MDQLTRFVRRWLAARPVESADHLDADRMSAFADGSLTAHERDLALSHLGACAECREVLALIANTFEEEVPVTRHGTGWWKWRVAATLALACLVLSIVLLPRLDLRAPEPAPVPPISKQAPPVNDEPTFAKRATNALPPSPARKPPSPVPNPTAPAIHLRPAQPKAMPSLEAPAPAPPEQPTEAAVIPSSSGSVLRRAPASTPRNNFFPAAARAAIAAKSAPAFDRRMLWRIASSETENGTLERSADGGQTWQPVKIESAGPLAAVSADGPDVWAGGAGGALFHSLDNGGHWDTVVVSNSEVKLTGAITGISVNSGRFVRLAVRDQNNWISMDGGHQWQQEH